MLFCFLSAPLNRRNHPATYFAGDERQFYMQRILGSSLFSVGTLLAVTLAATLVPLAGCGGSGGGSAPSNPGAVHTTNSTFGTGVPNTAPTTGTVATPAPAASVAPGGAGGSVAQGGTVSLSFGAVRGADVDTSVITDSNLLTSGGTKGIIGFNTSQAGYQVLTVSTSALLAGKPASQGTRLVTITATEIGGSVTAGKVYDLANPGDTSSCAIGFIQYYPSATGASTTKTYIASGGKVTVVSISGSSVTFKLDNVTLSGDSGSANATGTFSVSGTVTANL